MKKINFTNVGKTLKREQRLSSLYRLMLKNVKFFIIIQDWLNGYTFRTTQNLIILSSLTTFVELLLGSVYREHEHGIQSEVKLKENFFITGLENN